jgi:long-chain acyl-CoA synthetase
VVLENHAATLQQVINNVPTRHVLLAAVGDMLGFFKGALVNRLARQGKKMVPPFELPDAVRFNDAIALGRSMPYAPPQLGPGDLAVLQYTGGTTGMSKGAVLLHRNLVASLLQARAWYQPALRKLAPGEQIVSVCALPLHHIFGFNTLLMLGLHMGSCGILVADPRDIPGLLSELEDQRFHCFPAVNTLFNALALHPDVNKVDWSGLVLCVAGGMAVREATARLWQERTGCPICEGYGLTETSPSASCNPVDAGTWNGSIGLPMPGTVMKIIDDAGRELPQGQPGEIAIRGPQLMAGYWQRPEETAKAMTSDGFFRTGDIGVMDAQGYFRLVDRKKDMILVSGLQVFPAEVEEVIAAMPGVLEVAAVGVPDLTAAQAVKAVVVRKDPAITEADVRAWCETKLSGYKRPRIIEFRSELPKTAVGKVLRRELRA